MVDYGVIPEGWRTKTLQEIKKEIETDQLLEISTTLDVSPESPDGQRNAIHARSEAANWELLGLLYGALDPDAAEDTLLVNLCKLTGTTPQGATSSTAVCNCLLDIGTPLVSGTHYANVDGRPDELWTPVEDFTAPSTGTHSVTFKAVNTGPIPANAGTLTVINDGPVGWNDVTNPADALLGRVADTNEVLRQRREAELARAGSTSVIGIRADVLTIEVDGVQSILQCTVLENETDVYDPVTALPPHSIEVVIYDAPTVADDVVAQVIFESAAGGITKSVGNVTATATDEQGETHLVRFSRPTQVLIYLEYDLETDSTYAGDVAFKAAVAAALNSKHTSGTDVLHWTCMLAADLPGVVNVLSVKLGVTASPTLSNDIVLNNRQIARFDTTRITRT